MARTHALCATLLASLFVASASATGFTLAGATLGRVASDGGDVSVSPPGPDPSVAGFVKVPNTRDVHLFYWLFQSRGDPDSDPLVLVRAC